MSQSVPPRLGVLCKLQAYRSRPDPVCWSTLPRSAVTFSISSVWNMRSRLASHLRKHVFTARTSLQQVQAPAYSAYTSQAESTVAPQFWAAGRGGLLLACTIALPLVLQSTRPKVLVLQEQRPLSCWGRPSVSQRRMQSKQ